MALYGSSRQEKEIRSEFWHSAQLALEYLRKRSFGWTIGCGESVFVFLCLFVLAVCCFSTSIV